MSDILGFCPNCGKEMQATDRVWFVPDDDVHGEAVLCSWSCLRKWDGRRRDMSAPLNFGHFRECIDMTRPGSAVDLTNAEADALLLALQEAQDRNGNLLDIITAKETENIRLSGALQEAQDALRESEQTASNQAAHLRLIAKELRDFGDIKHVRLGDEGVTDDPLTVADVLELIAIQLAGVLGGVDETTGD